MTNNLATLLALAIIITGCGWSDSSPSPTPDSILDCNLTGMPCARTVGDGRSLFAVDADFFKANYPMGLSNALVYISACETLGIGDNHVADSLLVNDAAYLGWSQPVQSNAAQAAAAAFYFHALEHGSAATEAWSKLGPPQINAYTNDAGMEVQAELLVATDDDYDVRIRETMSLLDPDSGNPLTDGAEMSVIGTVGDRRNSG